MVHRKEKQMKKTSDCMVLCSSGITEEIKHQKAIPDGTKCYFCEHDHGYDHCVESQARHGELRRLMVGLVLYRERCYYPCWYCK